MRRLLLVPLCLTSTLLSSPAHALDCVGHPGVTAAGLVDGSAVRPDGSRLLDGFDGVLLGRATAVPRRVAGDPSAEVVLQVLLSVPSLPAQVVVGGTGPGWDTWQPFREGVAYAVPYRRAGDALRSELCEPVREVPEAELALLTDLAREQGWTAPAAAVVPDDPDPATATAAGGGGPGLGTAVPLVGGAAVVGAALTGLRRRRSG